ncbi:MAG: 4-hydroxy-tetrahydrodipicolinate synthase [Oscillospiraceae bacterium]
MKTPVFKGSCTALITPFTAEGIDFRRMGELLDYQEKNGTQAILVAGTTGENATLEIHEYDELVDFCIQHTAGRMKVIVGVGGNNTLTCLRKAQRAAEKGADAVLMTPPYYNKTTQRGLIEHFTFVADRAEIPLILYNVPSRTAISLGLDAYKTLSRHPNINGVKEASGDFSLIGKTIAACGDDLWLWSGNDDNTVPMMALGALGVISVASNLIPQTLALLCSLCLNGEFAAARALYGKYADFFDKLFIETNPIPIKAAMSFAGLDSGLLRLPLVGISDASAEKLLLSMQACGIQI